MRAFEKELHAGFPRMRGANLRGTVPITQALANEALHEWASVQIGPGNRVTARVFSIPFSATIERIDPDLTVVLRPKFFASGATVLILAFKPALRQFVHKQRGLVYVRLSSIPAVARYDGFWRHITQIRARTEPQTLSLDWELVVR
jgi:hypothetical protein